MPAEASRLQRKLGRRDRRLLAVLACAATVGGPAAAFALGGGGAPPADGCARVVKASWMGGATFRDCSRPYSSSARSAIESTMRDGR